MKEWTSIDICKVPTLYNSPLAEFLESALNPLITSRGVRRLFTEDAFCKKCFCLLPMWSTGMHRTFRTHPTC